MPEPPLRVSSSRWQLERAFGKALLTKTPKQLLAEWDQGKSGRLTRLEFRKGCVPACRVRTTIGSVGSPFQAVPHMMLAMLSCDGVR